MRPDVRLVGVRAGVDGYTIADGIAVKIPSDFTMPLLEDLLDDIVAVTDEEISEAIVLLLERAKLVVEGAGAVGVAALLSGKAGGSGTAVPILSGGNIDATMLISVMRHGLTSAGRYLVVRTHLSDRPGELIKLLSLVAEERGNVIAVEHHREGMDIPVTETEVELTLVTRDEEHCRTPARRDGRARLRRQANPLRIVARQSRATRAGRQSASSWNRSGGTTRSGPASRRRRRASTGRASTPAAASTLAAIDARVPALADRHDRLASCRARRCPSRAAADTGCAASRGCSPRRAPTSRARRPPAPSPRRASRSSSSSSTGASCSVASTSVT